MLRSASRSSRRSWFSALRNLFTPAKRSPASSRLRLESLEDRLALSADVAFQVTSNWGSGFGGSVTITNRDTTPVSGWELGFDFAPSINELWNARLVSNQGGRYLLKDAGYNSTIAPGGSVSFGFNALPGGTIVPPTNWVFTAGGTTPVPTLPGLSVQDIQITEGNNLPFPQAIFTVTLSQASTSPITVRYATEDGTALQSQDYTATSGTLTFNPGERQKTVAVTILSDTVVEPDETFFLALSQASGATLVRGRAGAIIFNDDTGVTPPPTPPPTTTFNYGEALQKALFFYEANRSGDLPDDYIVSWRGDSGMQDGADVGLDLTGGYYDAGDHVKFGLPMASSMTLLTWGLLQYPEAYASSGQLARLQEAIRWGTDWLMKAHPEPNVFYGQVGNGELDHSAWVAPEVLTMPRPAYRIDAQKPGSDLAGEAAAALAAASLAFRSSDPAYADQLLLHARQLYDFADTYRGKYSDSIPDAAQYYNSYSGYHDELVWGAVWLYKATGEQRYLDKAENLYSQNFAGQTFTWTHSWDDKRYGSVVLLAQLTGKDVYRRDAERWLDYWTVGINGGANRIAYTSGGLAFLNNWGSLRYASTTAFLALVYGDTVRDYAGRYHDFALKQINYILGQNPRNSSYLVGFGNNYPKNPHHRGGSGIWDGNVDNPVPNRHILYGALVGGPESANDFNYHDVRGNYISNEVALDYNAGLTGALARLYQEFGGQPLANFPIRETPDGEFFVEASIQQQGSTFTEVRALLNNRSAWPARFSSALSFRYFVDLSEVYAAGYGVNDVVVQSNYSQGASVGGLLPWNEAQRIYYVDVSFAGVSIGPGAGTFAREAQLRIGLRNGLPASAWDPTNDWSFQGLNVGRDLLRRSANIPVYEAGTQKLFGETPGASLPSLPRLSVDNITVVEGNSGSRPAVFTVRLSQPATQPVAVNYVTQNGTAMAGSDYTAAAGTLTFAPGTTVQTISLAILGDTLVEGNETFNLVLSNPSNAVLANAVGVATIEDDDQPATNGSVAFKVSSSWGTGFVGDFTVTNQSTAPLRDWVVEFDFDGDIVNIWNAVIERRVGNRYTVRSASWNQTIAAGKSIGFGIQAATTTGARPTNLVLR